MCTKLKDLIPRRCSKSRSRRRSAAKVIARETLSALRKDVTAKCWRRRHPQAQAAGRSRKPVRSACASSARSRSAGGLRRRPQDGRGLARTSYRPAGVRSGSRSETERTAFRATNAPGEGRGWGRVSARRFPYRHPHLSSRASVAGQDPFFNAPPPSRGYAQSLPPSRDGWRKKPNTLRNGPATTPAPFLPPPLARGGGSQARRAKRDGGPVIN
ncbi:MAG: hypothetical protein R3C52_00905 [Hyphomonadaceae bacterium]